MVIRGVADRVPERIVRLVYLDALVPEDGDSCFSLQAPELRERMAALVREQGDGWLIPVQRGGNDVPTHNTPHPFASWTQPVRLSNPAAAAIPRVYVRYTADKGPGQHMGLAMDRSWQRVRGAGWPTYEVNTIHQITPDPLPKAANLVEILAGA
jgi:hypothetical protein